MTETEQKKQRRPLRGLLVVSLALNLAVVGIIGGAFIAHHRFDDDDGPRKSERFGTPYIKALTREERRDVGRAIRNGYRSGEVVPVNTKPLYQQTLAVLRAETFDADAFGEVLKDIDRGSEGRRDLAREQLVARIASMSPEQRAGYADRLEEVLSRTSDKRGKPPKDGG
ncbi:MAG: periplasmic heavy metal sensor [Shimia sp.]|nr:periplasmic heavy metal sensor [Shimia sp.]